MLTTTVKHLRARKFRLITTGFAVLLGVAFVAGTLVLTDTVSRTFDNLFADVFAGTDAYVRGEEPFDAEDTGGPSPRPPIDESLVEVVGAVDGVALAYPDIGDYAQLVGKDGDAIGNPGQGAPTIGGNWVEDDGLNAFNIDEGRAPAADDEVVIDAGSAKDGDLAVGDRTKVLTARGAIDVEIVGIAKFGDVDSPGGASFSLFTTEAAQRYILEPGKLTGISVVGEDGISQEELARRIQEALPKGTEAVTGEAITEENQDAIQQFIDAFGIFMLVFALIALFVGSFIIYNTFSILVAQRTREMALLRAIGASRRQVMTSLLLEALVTGLVASIIGVVVGIGLAAVLRAVLAGIGFDMPAAGLAIEPRAFLVSIPLGLIVSMLAAWFPARRGAKIPPIAAMRDVAIEQRGRPRLRIAVGVAMLLLGALSLFSGLSGNSEQPVALVGIGALLTILGVTALGPLAARPVSGLLGRPVAALRGTSGVLARENAMRNPRRTSTTASALMIGVSLVAFITIFASSAKASIDGIFDEQFTGDFVLNTNTFGFGGVATTMAGDLRELDELSAVSALRTQSVEFDGKGTFVQGVDAVDMNTIADIGVLEGDLADLDERSLAVLDEKAEDEGWGIGDTVGVKFTSGDEIELTIRVIYENPELADEYFVDNSVFDAHVSPQFDSIVFAKVSEGTSIEDARAAMKPITDQFPNVEVQDRDEFIEAQSGFINQILALIYVMLFLAIIIALFGIANTLALSIVERTRELGLLRAVGMTRKQLKTMVRWEAVLIALFGTIGGLGVGIFFGWAMIQALEEEGFKVFNLPILQLAIIAVLAGLFGVLAAVLPARRASKLNVLEAISHD